MNLSEYPTTETDAIITRLLQKTGHVGQHNCPEEWVLHGRRLEQRLAVAREALGKIANTVVSVSQAEDIAEEALTAIAPQL